MDNELKEVVKEMLNNPLLENLKDMQNALKGNIESIYGISTAASDNCDMTEYARANGQIWGLQFAKSMLDSILRLEERRHLWDKEKESVTSE